MHLFTRQLVLAIAFAGAQCVTTEGIFSQDAQTPDNGLSAREIFYLADEGSTPKTKPAGPTQHKASPTKSAAPKTQVAQNSAAKNTPALGDTAGQSSNSPVHVADVIHRQYPPLG